MEIIIAKIDPAKMAVLWKLSYMTNVYTADPTAFIDHKKFNETSALIASLSYKASSGTFCHLSITRLLLNEFNLQTL
jgi:hypothetical protein